MNTVTSVDGTKITYDKEGQGEPLILVDGALCTRSSGSKPALVKLLADRFEVYSYDRRGRGDSGDTKPYSVQREIEDIQALIHEAGTATHLYGHSSGAALALEAALELGDKVRTLAMYEAPYNDDQAAQKTWKEYGSQLAALLDAGRGGDSVALFMKLVGMPTEQIDGMRHAPNWPVFEALGPTLAYDQAVLSNDGVIPIKRARSLTIPVIVMSGSVSYPFMSNTAKTLSAALPDARFVSLEGQTHDPQPEVLVPVLADFFSRQAKGGN